MGALLADATVQEGLFGFGLTNLDIGVAAYEPTINDFLEAAGSPRIPNFTAARATADSFDIYTGSMDFIRVAGRNLELKLNDGDNWELGGGIPEFGPAVIDWAASFPEVVDDAATADIDETDAVGMEIVTGGDPVVLDYDGNQRIGVELEYGLVSLFDFVHLEGLSLIHI